MNGITAPQMCTLAEMHFPRFESLRRRQVAALALWKANPADVLALPLGTTEERKWTRYNFADTLALAVAVALEKAGADFGEAVGIAQELAAFFQHDAAGDFWVARSSERAIRDDVPSRRHVSGSLQEVLGHLMIREDVVASIVVNVSAIARRIEYAARDFSLVVNGNRFETAA